MNKHLWQSKYRVKCNWQTNYQVSHSGSRGGMETQKEASALRSPTLHFINSKNSKTLATPGTRRTWWFHHRHKAKESKRKKKQEIKTPCLTVPSHQVSVEICRASAELNRCSAELANTLAQLFSLSQKIEKLFQTFDFRFDSALLKAGSSLDLGSTSQAPPWDVMNVGRAAGDWSKHSEYREAFRVFEDTLRR